MGIISDVFVGSGCHNKRPQTSGLNNKHLFLTVLKAWSAGSRWHQGWFLMKPLFLACRRLPSCCVLWVPFPLGKERERDLASLPLLIRPPVLLDQGPTLTTSFNLNYPLKGPISRYSHIGGWGFNVNFRGDTT